MASRRQRKAATHIKDADSIPLAQPDRSGPKTKTLFELAEEREAELRAKADAINASRARSTENPRGQSDGDEPFLSALLYALSLTALHFTLDVLVFHQYGQEILWSYIAWRLVPTFLSLLVIIYLFHTETAMKFPLARQALFALTSTAIGCYMVYVGNERPFLAVMLRAPPLGTAWVWCTVEMRWDVAALSLAAVGGWTWWKGFELW